MDISTPEKIKSVDFSIKRSNKLCSLKRKSFKIITQTNKYSSENNLSDEKEKHLMRLVKNLAECSSFSLYSENIKNKDISYYTSYMCGNKNCPICNYNRQKQIRRKYFKWFDENSEVIRVINKKTKKTKIITQTQYKERYEENNKYGYVNSEKYDVMHLTLTVPHYKDTGFNGDKYYYYKIAYLYWKMRKMPFWNENVYGGEYGIETTNTDNGLNIHIHSLIFVKRFTQSRNNLHKDILEYWNKHTINKDNLRTSFTTEVRASIKKGNKLIDDEFIDKLNPMGGTLLTLETIFSWNNDRTEKVRAKEFGSKEMLYAVMEAISYHFSPDAFDKDTGELDLELLSEILPVIYCKALYKKFGCLHGEKSLNIHFKTEKEEMINDFVENADTEGLKKSVFDVDTETGEMTQIRKFFICNPAYIYHFGDDPDNLKITLSKKARDKMRYIPALSVPAAIDFMINLAINGKRGRPDERKNVQT